MTQRQLASRLGISQSFVAQMESGARPIPPAIRRALDELFASTRPAERAAPAPRGAYGRARREQR